MDHIQTLAKKSSRKQVPKMFKQINWNVGAINVDLGGGAYDDASEWLHENHSVTNLVIDPYNRSQEHNANMWDYALGVGIQTITIANVLNVIPDKTARKEVLQRAYNLYIRKQDKLFACRVHISCYNASGQPSVSECQTCMPLKDYIPEIKEVFKNSPVIIKNGMITILPVNK